MVSYLVRDNWAFVQGAIKPLDEYKGIAYDDMVVIGLDDIEVTDYGKPKPFVYEILTVDRQRANIEEKKDGLRSMYRQGRKLND